MSKKSRNSSIELLRILSMLTIIGVHLFGACKTEYFLASGGKVSYEFFSFVKLLFSYGVNIFVIITGYYMVNRNEVSIRKAFDLLWQISFYGAILFGVSLAIGINTFSFAGLTKSLFPILGGLRWFVKAYIILYLLIPFINVALNNISQTQHKSLIVILVILFSIWPFILPYPPMDDYGFSYNHFVVLYVISAYLRKYITEIRTTVCCVLFLTSTLLLFGLMHIDTQLPIISTMKEMVLAHNSPIKLVACFSLFMIFAKAEWYANWVNTLAASAFAVYVIHGDFNTMGWMFTRLLRGVDFQCGWMWLPHLAATLFVVYFSCFVIDWLVRSSIAKCFNNLFDRIKILNIKISTK